MYVVHVFLKLYYIMWYFRKYYKVCENNNQFCDLECNVFKYHIKNFTTGRILCYTHFLSPGLCSKSHFWNSNRWIHFKMQRQCVKILDELNVYTLVYVGNNNIWYRPLPKRNCYVCNDIEYNVLRYWKLLLFIVYIT